MRFLTVLGIFFYAAVICLMGVLMILFSQQIITTVDIAKVAEIISIDANLRYALLSVGILLIFVAIIFAQIILGKIERERSIAFQNPSGPVIISLSAIEDLIKRLTNNIFEIKESRPFVIKKKKELEVYLRIVLKYETNIPELTLKLQDMVKSRLQEVLRLEDPIVVKIHVQKIISIDEKKRKDSREPEQVPFQGYRSI